MWYLLRMETAIAHIQIGAEFVTFSGMVLRENGRVYVKNIEQLNCFDVKPSAVDLDKAAEAIAESALAYGARLLN